MSYSMAEKRQIIGKVGADDKGSADVLPSFSPARLLSLWMGSSPKVEA